MTQSFYKSPACFKTSSKNGIPIHVVDTKAFKKLKPNAAEKRQLEQAGFKGKDGNIVLVRDKNGAISHAYVGYDHIGIYTLSPLVEALKNTFSKDFLKDVAFQIAGKHKKEDLNALCIGWGLANYAFETYKKSTKPMPQLVWPKGADKTRVNAFVQSAFLIRNLVNTPAHDLNTNDLAGVASEIADKFKAGIKITKGKALEKEFPLIHAVGMAGPTPPQLVDISWGKKTHPKVTIVGKGIVFDTGGLNIKTRAMEHMKKDMGGAANALALAWLIMSLKLPVRLRILCCLAENSISSQSMRPGDVFKSRKGLTVEVKDTDAEGRMVLADGLALACEDKPDIVIDYGTLTGHARVATGHDISASFSNRRSIDTEILKAGDDVEDPVWPQPLYLPYNNEISSLVADVANDGRHMQGAIYAALFLHRFVDDDVDWLHFDFSAWELNGKPGRPVGGKDMGIRAAFHMLEQRYGKSL